MSWRELADWWRRELEDDPAYRADIEPLVGALLSPVGGELVLDVGCGEGRLMRWLAGSRVRSVGVDISVELLTSARVVGPVVRGMLPSLGWARDAVFDGAIVSLVLEHLEDETALFAELGRVVRPGGRLALVINHPIFTAPKSAPIEEDNEVLWRPGTYFRRGYTDEKAGEATIRFYHRTIAELLNAASAGSWDLQRLVELGATDVQIDRHPPLALQKHIPRLLGGSWIRRD